VSKRDSDRFLVAPGTPFCLDDRDPADTSGAPGDKKATQKALEELSDELMALQERLYAESGQALLVVLQAIDAGGKDGTVKHVFGGTNPQGVRVTSFKQPTPEELAHDFLWRIHQEVPKAGEITIFNRSHYEDVVTVRVRGLAPEHVWRPRYEHIRNFERLLEHRRTRVVKIFLHISRAEQARRFEERLTRPDKRWKWDPDDVEAAARWDGYMDAYADAMAETSTTDAPWWVIPADDKKRRNWAVATIVTQALRAMDPQWPPAPSRG
jgi:PPK2 family polyphosphate:nucleotide phosphotransferase